MTDRISVLIRTDSREHSSITLTQVHRGQRTHSLPLIPTHHMGTRSHTGTHFLEAALPPNCYFHKGS